MRLAVISDVHANLHALEAVLEAIAELRADRILCLGDLVGYNASPSEVVEIIAERVDWLVAGNHDRDIAHPSDTVDGTRALAREVQAWTRTRLDSRYLTWLSELPSIAVSEDFVAVHGCYLNDTHVNGYVTSTMLEDNLRATRKRADWPRLAFCGHTHVPLVGLLDAHGVCHELPLLDQAIPWPESSQAILVNPGAVGQPRDGSNRAAFALVDTQERIIVPYRVPYDVEGAARAIAQAGLPSSLAVRLRQGR